jgi:hypothetical protein
MLLSQTPDMLRSRGRFGPGRRLPRIRRWLKLAALVAVVLFCFFRVHRSGSNEAPASYEKLEQAAGAARDKVRKTWNAKGIHDTANSTLGVSSCT